MRYTVKTTKAATSYYDVNGELIVTAMQGGSVWIGNAYLSKTTVNVHLASNIRVARKMAARLADTLAR